jgi:hypothetical protein
MIHQAISVSFLGVYVFAKGAKMSVPVIVDYGTGNNWLEAH